MRTGFCDHLLQQLPASMCEILCGFLVSMGHLLLLLAACHCVFLQSPLYT